MFRPSDLPDLVDQVEKAMAPDRERSPEPGIVTVPLSSVQPEAVRWLWPGWIPRGRLTLIAGDPGVGKSWFSQAVVASITTGRGLCGEQDPQDVILVAMEDDPADTLRPRLEALEADLERVHLYQTVKDLDREGKPVERGLTFPEDAGLLADLIRRTGAALVIIDPLVAVQNAAIDSHRQAAMRSILQPLHGVAQDTGAAIVFTVHLRKGASENSIYRVNGSIDLIAAVRTAIAVGRDPDDPARRGAAVNKSNLAEYPPPIAFTIIDGRLTFEDKPATDLTADKLLGPPAGSEERSAVEEAQDFLQDLLADGPVEAKAVMKEAKAAGIADITLRRAKTALGITVKRSTRPGERTGPWVWSLRDDQPDHLEPRRPNTKNDHLEKDDLSLTAPRDSEDGFNMINDHLEQSAAKPTAPRDSGDNFNMIIDGVRGKNEDDHVESGGLTLDSSELPKIALEVGKW
ncbi:MAG: AAA family ATPase [Bacillota bacterium]